MFKYFWKHCSNSPLYASGVPRTEELGRIFEFNNFNYFDVFPIFKGFNENLEDMNIIAGAELFKLKVEIKK